MRRPFLAGNWKMNLERKSALALVRDLAGVIGRHADRDVAVFPPFVYLDEIARALAGTRVRVGAQNLCDELEGAFTGEVSGRQLVDVGAELVLVGHSERRHVYGETDELCQRKVAAALGAGLDVVLCVGETIGERQAGATERVVARQLTSGLAGLGPAELSRVTLAYEPVWAIGTGLTATPEQAGAVHEYLRGLVAGLFDEAAAGAIRIQYGGSVKPDNIDELMAVPGIDGALVGGASLKADAFGRIIGFH